MGPNLASMQDSACPGICTWSRTVRNPAAAVTWTPSFSGPSGVAGSVSPSGFTIASGATQAVTFKVQDPGLANVGSGYRFASFTLTPDTPSIPPASFPVAVSFTCPANLTLANHTVSGPETFVADASITTGPSFEVGGAGVASLTSGVVQLGNGTTLGGVATVNNVANACPGP
jgi:hypothetical protein